MPGPGTGPRPGGWETLACTKGQVSATTKLLLG